MVFLTVNGPKCDHYMDFVFIMGSIQCSWELMDLFAITIWNESLFWMKNSMGCLVPWWVGDSNCKYYIWDGMLEHWWP